MNATFHAEAEDEFRQAIEHYEALDAGLGQAFAVEVLAALDRACAHPQAWPIVNTEIRRCQTQRFPFGVLYALDGDHLLVLAVMHLHRHPDYWRHRVTSL